MGKPVTLLLLLSLLPSSGHWQAEPVRQTPDPASAPHRNSHEEDVVAHVFDTVRADAKLHRLSRITDRKELEQLVCTASVNGKITVSTTTILVGTPSLPIDIPSTLYKTASPGDVTPELRTIALFERPRGRSGRTPGHKRYSVAVWPVQREKDSNPEYWVGIGLFWSTGSEFFQNHFTDSIEYKNKWKRFVAPECKEVK
jgi:hypothetical protein